MKECFAQAGDPEATTGGHQEDGPENRGQQDARYPQQLSRLLGLRYLSYLTRPAPK